LSSFEIPLSSSEIPARLHFVGVGGSGMSALAEVHARRGGYASGSDRAFDAGERASIRAALAAAGVVIRPQDGSGARGVDAVVVSTAVEDAIPDVREARAAGLPVLHRSELLARFAARGRSIAVTGTSGKSTVTAMVFTILRHAGLRPSLITGGPLVALQEEGLLGNAHAETGGDLLVFEADESDGSLVNYAAWCGVVLNLQRDHKEPAEVAEMFRVFRGRLRGPLVRGDDPALAFLDPAVRCGEGETADLRPEDLALRPDGSAFLLDGVPFSLPVPGRHDVWNALAAVAACREAGVDDATAADALRGFRGVARRFQVLGEAGGVTVIDDFAHNPAKLRAALATARLRARSGRVLAVFQPHGYGPTRFLRDDLITAFAAALGPRDVLWLPEIFYAGGTVVRDVSSRDIIDAVAAAGRDARFVADRAELPALVAAEARAGDLAIIMGARDPSLTELGRALLAELS
jgi:UDP-N-acetylmuramate--alanine ligase